MNLATFTGEPPMPDDLGPITIERYQRRNWRWKWQHYWRARAGNGEKMGSGEGYDNSADRDDAVDRLFPDRALFPRKDVAK